MGIVMDARITDPSTMFDENLPLGGLALRIMTVLQNTYYQNEARAVIQRFNELLANQGGNRGAAPSSPPPTPAPPAVQQHQQHSYNYVIQIKGGGGPNSKKELRLDFPCIPTNVRAKGTTDANDGRVRVGLGGVRGQYANMAGTSLKSFGDVRGPQLFVVLDGKWGSDNDSTIEIRLTLGCQGTIRYVQLDSNRNALEYVKIDPVY